MNTRPVQDERFRMLMEEADNGDEASIHGLWAEFGYDYRSGRFPEERGALDPVDGIDLIDDGQDGGVK